MLIAIGSIALMMVLAFVQNVSFSIVSRSRNRDNVRYHQIAAFFSNAVWFVTAKFLIVTNNMSWLMFIPYTAATVYGSSTGMKVSMWVEKKLGIGV